MGSINYQTSTSTGVLRTLLYLPFQVLFRHLFHKILWFLPWPYHGIYWLSHISSRKAANKKNDKKKDNIHFICDQIQSTFWTLSYYISCLWGTTIILPCWWERFSSYAIVCPVSSCMLSNSEHNDTLYGRQLHIMLSRTKTLNIYLYTQQHNTHTFNMYLLIEMINGCLYLKNIFTYTNTFCSVDLIVSLLVHAHLKHVFRFRVFWWWRLYFSRFFLGVFFQHFSYL